MLGGLLTAGALTLGVANHASALAYLDFDQISDGGKVSYDGTGGPLKGTDIRFDLIKGIDTPLNSGVDLDCHGCKLNFETGSNISDAAPNYSWHGGGSLKLTGVAKYGSTTIASGTLLTGTWDDPVLGLLNTITNSFSLIGNGTNTTDSGLLSFFGLPYDASHFADSELAIVTRYTKNGRGFNANVTEADFTGSVPTATPEPSTILLLSTGLLGMVGYGWRRNLQTVRG
jgi:hypothetical protein